MGEAKEASAHEPEPPQLASLGGKSSSPAAVCDSHLRCWQCPILLTLLCLFFLSPSYFSALCYLFIVLNPSPGSRSSLLSLRIYVALHFKRSVSSACSPEFELHSFTSHVSWLLFRLGQIRRYKSFYFRHRLLCLRGSINFPPQANKTLPEQLINNHSLVFHLTFPLSLPLLTGSGHSSPLVLQLFLDLFGGTKSLQGMFVLSFSPVSRQSMQLAEKYIELSNVAIVNSSKWTCHITLVRLFVYPELK